MTSRFAVLSCIGVLTAAGVVAASVARRGEPEASPAGKASAAAAVPEPPLKDSWLGRGVDWLARAQHEDGGWGAGSSARQDIRDARVVQTDPATTAFAGLALIRAGNTPTAGAYRENVQRAVGYIVAAVESSGDGPTVTSLTGTQPQAKMGPLVDTSLTVQFLSRVVPMIPASDPLRAKADAALDKALGKLQKSQESNGEWGRGGWANALQGSLGTVALEMAKSAGKEVPAESLARARATQQRRLDPGTGRADASGAAGVELYAWAGAARNSAAQSAAARKFMDDAKADGRLEKDAEISEANLEVAGAPAPEAAMLSDAYKVSAAQATRLADDALLGGFGNNGGEEFLSYMMTSEALVMRGGEEWTKWHAKMDGLLQKVQSADGSWTGHHCITSPVFCTAAVVQTMTADRDVEHLRSQQKTGTANPASAR